MRGIAVGSPKRTEVVGRASAAKTEDGLHDGVKNSHDALEKAGIKHVWVESGGSHNWTVWRKYLADFAPRSF